MPELAWRCPRSWLLLYEGIECVGVDKSHGRMSNRLTLQKGSGIDDRVSTLHAIDLKIFAIVRPNARAGNLSEFHMNDKSDDRARCCQR
jgi:hypothetical protein